MFRPAPVGENRIHENNECPSLTPEEFKTQVLNPQSTIYDPQIHLQTGIGELDQLLKGGIERGKITEIVGANSSGKTSLLLSILAQATALDEIAAYIDPLDSLDPQYAQKAGINLKRLLWIRCRRIGANELDCQVKALKACDILCQAGGFGVIVLDVAFPTWNTRKDPRISLHSWFRLQRALRGTRTILLVISSQKITGNASSIALSVERNQSRWTSQKRSQVISKPYFQGLESEAYLLRGKIHGSVTIHCRF